MDSPEAPGAPGRVHQLAPAPTSIPALCGTRGSFSVRTRIGRRDHNSHGHRQDHITD